MKEFNHAKRGLLIGTNLGGIHIQVQKHEINQSSIAEQISKFWIERGARSSKKEALHFEPLSVSTTGNLGFAILTPGADDNGNQWIAVYDSERYFSDLDLAKVLAEKFKTLVWCWSISDAAGEASAYKLNGATGIVQELHGLGDVYSLMDPLPKDQICYDQILTIPSSDTEGVVTIAFENIPFRKGQEYSGPE